MEYLQREFAQMMKNKKFKFHPRCQKLGVVHVCFADDLLMFCRADLQSLRLLRQTFQKFSEASGLQANAEKSATYLAGVSANQKQDILQELEFPESTLPFKYLGSTFGIEETFNHTMLASSGEDYSKNQLLDNKSFILCRACTTDQVSYIWHIVIVGTDLLTTKEGDEDGRSYMQIFLWTGSSTISKKALVSWDKVCLPQGAGGLNVLNLVVWNRAAVAKHFWAVAKKKDCLWIKWIHTFYIKHHTL
uniref:Reverse transcriptase domain-containing protein n=1 Tax=Nicotiana tabacum TaxID=4097 RepID=A0A1S4BYY1_TOBAC|nr:PREDICTED: uncharacterized protein LOC107813308 [Nicotiana tabacum]